MSHDIFVSHSVKDQEISDCICTYLESKGIECFMDTRNLIPGKPYPVQIVDAIKESRAVVLVFSFNSDTSESVLNEVGIARNNKVPIIPVRIENMIPSGLAFFITTAQWFDAFPQPIEKHLPKLVNAIRVHLETKQKEEEIVPEGDGSQSQQDKFSDTITDQDWHDIDYDALTSWVKGKTKILDAGKVVKGRTFLYRRNRYSGKYQRRLVQPPQ